MVSQRQQQDYRLQELGDFLRTRRARLTPEEVGLPRGSRLKRLDSDEQKWHSWWG